MDIVRVSLIFKLIRLYLFKEYSQNKRLSVVLTGKLLDHYRIFKFQENGRFLNNIKQPHIHKIASLDDREE